MSAEQISILLL